MNELNHKCNGCRYKSEHQEMGFRPFGVCTRETNLIEAEKAYKAEFCPYKKYVEIKPIFNSSDKKKFDEMRYLADEMGKAISTEYEKRVLADERKLEAVLKENGWRKASEVAEEIFAEIEDVINNIGYFDELDFNALKKKYTEEWQ